MRGCVTWIVVAAAAMVCSAATGPAATANRWVRLEQAEVKRGDALLIYEPALKRFMVLGGGISSTEYAKPHPFDELALDLARGGWENWIPPGKDWGPAFGDCTPPGWKDGRWTLTDIEGNCRPNLVTSGVIGVGYYGQYAFDPDTRRTYLYARDSTFCYEAAARVWKDLAPADHPNKALGGQLLWGSMCYVPPLKKVLLFGGGNVATERGDPGTWTYDPATNTWKQLHLEKQPPQRTLSPMVYDPVTKKVVLFGGDQLNQLLSDTWTFDGQKWEEKKPALAPAPRAGHALVWLAGAKRVLLLGGYAYESGYGYYPRMYKSRPLEAWTYDAAADRWALVAVWEKGAPPSASGPSLLRAAAGSDDRLAVLSGGGARGGGLQTWLCQVDASRTDAAGTAKLGVRPGTVERRTTYYAPEWYGEAGPGDPAETEAELAALPVNTWMLRPQPNRPRIEANEGSAVFSPELDLIINYQGGHCCYGGTAPLVYDVRTDRWSIPFAPEMYLEFCASNGGLGAAGTWSFTGSPWMPGHVYKSIGYEPESKSMVYIGMGDNTFFFDPVRRQWLRSAKRNPFKTHVHLTAFATTPKGVVAWVGFPQQADNQLYLLDPKTHEWSKLPLAGRLPTASFHDHSMVYDPKRDRLLLFAGIGDDRGDVMAYDVKTGSVAWLKAAGRASIAAVADSRRRLPCQEMPYLSDYDMVMGGVLRVPGDDGKPLCPLYDCEKNAWFAIELGGTDPTVKASNSSGVMYDAKRKLVWAVNNACQISALRLDPRTAALKPLE